MKRSKANPEQLDARIPRPALAVVAVGLLLSIGIFGISVSTGENSTEITWDAVEPVKTPPAVKLGADGSMRPARTTLSALAPNKDGFLIFQVAGVVQLDSGGNSPTTLRCDVSTTNGGDSMIARTTKRRAVWPRPSENLANQAVPELAEVKFNASGTRNSGLPIRDAFRRYTDSKALTLVAWDGYEDRTQHWLWTMPEGAGEGGAALAYAVIFWTDERPTGEIDCRAQTAATSGSPAANARVKVPLRLAEWPIKKSKVDTETGSRATDVK